MTKSHINTIISNLKKADLVTKVTPWLIEGLGDGKSEVKYVGFKIKDDWLELFSPKDNLLLKFVIIKNTVQLEIYLANNPPFVNIHNVYLRENEKWEKVLGELKRKLKKDKEDFINHDAKVDNLWIKIKPYLRSK